MSWTYDPTQLAKNVFMQVRLLIGDTKAADQQLQDEEINFYLTTDTSIWRAAANCCRTIASNAARRADSVQGELRTVYSAITRNYNAMAAKFENTAVARGGGLAYAGGISVQDKLNQELDGDRVSPQFVIGMEDNLLPVGEVGNENIGAPAPVISQP